MRYYRLVLANAQSGQVWIPTGEGFFLGPSGTYSLTSHTVGNSGQLVYNPGCVNVEFDIPVYKYATPQGGAIIRIWGLGVQSIGRATDLNGANFQLYGGMQLGIAGARGLANPAQVGVIAQGTVFQAFGNWQGINQTIDLIVNPGFAVPAAGITFTWAPGQPLAAALLNALTAAYPAAQVSVNIAGGLAVPNNAIQGGCYPTLEAFAGYLSALTQPLGQGIVGYQGVQVTFVGNRIYAFDATTPGKTVQLNFQDLIGQPTWMSATEVNFKTVLRGDINLGDQVTFPTGVTPPYALTSPEAAVPGAPARSKTIFQNSFVVSEVHHFGNYRQPDAESWNTTFTGIVTQQ